MDTVIRSVRAREILDSRGNPAVEIDAALAGGAIARASARRRNAIDGGRRCIKA